MLCKSMGWFLYNRDLYHERVMQGNNTTEDNIILLAFGFKMGSDMQPNNGLSYSHLIRLLNCEAIYKLKMGLYNLPGIQLQVRN